MRIAFWGTSEFIGSIQRARFLRCLVAAGIRPALVITAPDSLGNGKSEPPAVKGAALEFGIPVLQPVSLDGFSGELARHELDLSLVAAYGKILPPDALAVPKYGSLNVHPSLLPRWRGPTPIQAALLAGDIVSGVTIIQMDAEMDHGPIAARREFSLAGRAWIAPELSDELTDLGVELFCEILDPWLAGKLTPQPQNHAAATYSRLLKREDGHVDWSQPANVIERKVRAFQPWPGAYTFWRRDRRELRLTIEAAGIAGGSGAAGAVRPANGTWGVITGGGMLIIRRLKPEGGKSMSGADFLRGHPDIIGVTLQ